MREIFDSTVERLFADLVTPDTVRAAGTGNWPAELWAALGLGWLTVRRRNRARV